MKKALQITAVLLVGFFAYGLVERIISAEAEQKFRLERSRCQLNLIKHWKQIEGKAALGTGTNRDYFSLTGRSNKSLLIICQINGRSCMTAN